MKKFLVTACLMLAMYCASAQFLIFLDKGDVFKSPEVDMVVMDKYSFAKLHYTSGQYDSLKKEVVQFGELLAQMDSEQKQVQQDYECLLSDRSQQINDLTEAYNSMRNNLQLSIERQNKLQVDYVKLQRKDRRHRRWRNFFMGTTAVLGGIVYLIVRF